MYMYMPIPPITDPPYIRHIQNFTLQSEPHGVESALLECEVESREADLEVWVNWTTGAEIVVGQKCHVLGEGHSFVFFLVLHNVTKKDVRPYICQLYSAYSPTKVEEQRTAKILIAGQVSHICVTS